MMNLKKVFLVAAAAVALPLAASAATMTINDVVTPYNNSDVVTMLLGDGSAQTVNTNYFEGDSGTFTFEIKNMLGTTADIAFVDGTVNQSMQQNFGFYTSAANWAAGKGNPGLTISFDGVATQLNAGQAGIFSYSKVLGVGESVILSFSFGAVECNGTGDTGCPDIDFVVSAEAAVVPLPAAGFLLLGALGSLAVMRRKRS